MGSRGRVRSNAWIWVFSSTHKTNALSGGLRYRPTISRTFSIKSGSDDSLKVSVRWGCSPKARHMRLMVLWLRPERLAIERVLQWVASVGVVSRVMLTTLSTSASAVLRGVPGLGSSSSPSTRRSKNRDLHFPTVGLDTLRACECFEVPLLLSGMLEEESALASFTRFSVRLGEGRLREGFGHFPGDITSRVWGILAVSAHPINAPQRSRLCATATRSMTLVTLASPRTLNWDTP